MLDAIAIAERSRRLLVIVSCVAGALIVALAIAIGVLWFSNAGLRRANAETISELSAERSAHRGTVDRYEIAAAIASRREAETLARVTGEQHAIKRNTDGLQARLNDSLAGYERLRKQADAYSGSVTDADMSAAREATCRAYANAACDELPALLKAAQDNTDQLVSLIAWATEQGEVSVSERDAVGEEK